MESHPASANVIAFFSGTAGVAGAAGVVGDAEPAGAAGVDGAGADVPHPVAPMTNRAAMSKIIVLFIKCLAFKLNYFLLSPSTDLK
jgi:hypothetical protein